MLVTSAVKAVEYCIAKDEKQGKKTSLLTGQLLYDTVICLFRSLEWLILV